MSLRQRAHDALTINNDIECMEALGTLRRECREKGLDPERVNQIIRSENHAIYNASKQHTEIKQEQPQEPPQPPEPVAAEQTPEQVRKMSQRGTAPEYEASNPSGTRSSGKHRGLILKMADEKTKGA